MPNATIWVDEHPVDPAWPPPPGEEEPRSNRIRGWLSIGLPVLVGIVVLAVVAAFGGFRQRSDQVVEVPAGSMIETGPFQLRFERATIQQVTDWGEEKPTQNVIVFGTGVNTWTQSLAPDQDQFAASGKSGSEVKEPEGAHLSTWLDGPRSLAPELPPQSIEVEFVFSGDFDPGEEIRFMASDLTYGDRSYLGVGSDETWYNEGDRFLMHLPLERLPDEDKNS